jgi:hypothetical protein
MCIRCGETELPIGFELCTSCAVEVRVEVAEGLYRIGRYLAAWAAFQEWERRVGRAAA